MSKKLEALLKPCPYCGGIGHVRIKRMRGRITFCRNCHDNFGNIFIQCKTCHARTLSGTSLEEVSNAWNIGVVIPNYRRITA